MQITLLYHGIHWLLLLCAHAKKPAYDSLTHVIYALSQWYFSSIGRLWPKLSARLGVYLWGKSWRPRWREWEHHILSQATRTDLSLGKHKVATYRWGDGEQKILLVHGWNSRASHFRSYIAALTKRGYSVLGLDAIGHGNSSGNWTNIIQYLEAIELVRQHYGDFHAVIGHSFGGFSLPRAINDGLQCDKAVILAAPDSMEWLFCRFVRMARIHPLIEDAMRKRVSEMLDDCDWEHYSPLTNAPKLAHIQSLILIDTDDVAVEVETARNLHQHWPDSELLITSGLGHQKILRHRNALKPVLKFIGEKS